MLLIYLLFLRHYLIIRCSKLSQSTFIVHSSFVSLIKTQRERKKTCKEKRTIVSHWHLTDSLALEKQLKKYN